MLCDTREITDHRTRRYGARMAADPPGVDTAALRSHLDAQRPGLVTGLLRAELIAGGRSNLTYVLTDEAGARWVLRRPPLGHVLATAHDMAREFTVMTALGGSAVPVPATVLLCRDDAVLGAPFYLMEKVEGTIFRTPAQIRAELPREDARALSFGLVDVLADLHAVDPAAVGLAEFGRPDGYLERQVRRWAKQLGLSRSRDLPRVDALGERLAAAIPVTRRHGIVHGDYRLDNVLVATGDGAPRVAAVLDWEMSTLGDPLADVGLLVMYWSTLMADAGATPEHGFATPDEVVARYGERTGDDLSDIEWYVAFGCYKLAVVAEGIHYRYTQGKTVGDGFERYGAMPEPLAERGLARLA